MSVHLDPVLSKLVGMVLYQTQILVHVRLVLAAHVGMEVIGNLTAVAHSALIKHVGMAAHGTKQPVSALNAKIFVGMVVQETHQITANVQVAPVLLVGMEVFLPNQITVCVLHVRQVYVGMVVLGANLINAVVHLVHKIKLVGTVKLLLRPIIVAVRVVPLKNVSIALHVIQPNALAHSVLSQHVGTIHNQILFIANVLHARILYVGMDQNQIQTIVNVQAVLKLFVGIEAYQNKPINVNVLTALTVHLAGITVLEKCQIAVALKNQ